MMKRRQFLGLLCGAAAGAHPRSLYAQTSGVRLVGLLSSTSAGPYKSFVEAVFAGLKEQGFAPGHNIVVEQRWADGQYDRLPGLASDLLRLRVTVIVAIAPPAARAAKAASASVPVVFSTAGDPVGLGLVASLNRPGGNLTGVYFPNFATVSKRMEFLTKLVPAANTIGILVNPSNPSTAPSTAEAHLAAKVLGKTLISIGAKNAQDIDAAFARFVEQKVEAISIEADPFLSARREQIVAQAAAHSLPTMYSHREFPADGGLISYGTNLSDAYRQIGIYTGRILNGERPANLPIMQASKFELVINLKTAKTLGLAVPNSMQLLADEVIE